ncbi:MAG: cytochrome c family protein, partial [Planctomycetes bacterium]|nr:cytochrome c family protein [Planctomycetota bacterium]
MVSSIAPATVIRGVVRDGDQPLSGARVRIRGSADFILTDRQGRFTIAPPSASNPVILAAWKDGYFIGGEEWRGKPLTIDLRKLPERDNPGYVWVDPSPDPAGIHNCGNCHEEIYEEWRSSGHAHAAVNRRFVNLYDGTDWAGRPGHGWSLLDEHPHGAGVCAACHAPTVDFSHPASDDLRAIDGVAAHGVHCDFCHKVRDVELSHVGLTHGRFGMSLLRPHQGQLFFGPLDDVTRDEDIYSPLQSESHYCAACHEGVVFGVHVYSTYSEWLESPAAREGRSCQSCHMTPTGRMTNIAPGAGGVERDSATLASHTFLPGGRESMLRRCLKVEVEERSEQGVT